eukprot:s2495_g7.t1
MAGWLAGCLDGWLDGWMDGCMDGWMDGWIAGWIAGAEQYDHGPTLSLLAELFEDGKQAGADWRLVEAAMAQLSGSGLWHSELLSFYWGGFKALKSGLRAQGKRDLLRQLEEAQQWPQALALLTEAQESRVVLDDVVYASAIRSCGSGQQWQAALGLYEDMKVPQQQAHGALVAALGAAGRWERALVLFGETLEKGLDMDVVAYNSMITAAEFSKKWPWALHFLEEMREEEVQPDTASYNSAISSSVGPARL